MMLHLPYNAEFVPARNRRFQETVVFIHHFGGSRRSVIRHLKMVSDLGFDVVRFDLKLSDSKRIHKLPLTPDLKFGIHYVWSKQVDIILSSLTGPKIIYGFSMPSASGFEAASLRTQQDDVRAIICDGGPFSRLWQCTWNLYRHHYKVESHLLRGAFTGISMLLWGLNFPRKIRALMKNLRPDFPVLSIRGLNDPLVPVEAINDFFAGHEQLDLKVLEFPEGGHLDGIKRFPELYTTTVKDFLETVGTPLPESLKESAIV